MPNLKNVLQIVVEIDRGGRPLALKQDYIKISSPCYFAPKIPKIVKYLKYAKS